MPDILHIKIINQSEHALPAYETAHAAGMDLRANLKQDIELKPKIGRAHV